MYYGGVWKALSAGVSSGGGFMIAPMLWFNWRVQTRPQAPTRRPSKSPLPRPIMALPTALANSLTPPELELIAMEMLVDIVPLFRSERIRLISVSRFAIDRRVFISHQCSFRAHTVHFDPQRRQECPCGSQPIWSLRRNVGSYPRHGWQLVCENTRVHPDILLKLSRNSSGKIASRNIGWSLWSLSLPVYRNQQGFTGCVRTKRLSPPSISFPYRAPDDIHSPEKIRGLLKDIREARQAKSRDGLAKLDPDLLDVRDHYCRKFWFLKITLGFQFMFYGNKWNPTFLRQGHGCDGEDQIRRNTWSPGQSIPGHGIIFVSLSDK